MRFSTVAFTLLGASAASASTLFARQNPYPDCAIPCVANADLGDCVSNTNTKCLCTNANFISTTTTCIEKACSGADLEQALTVSRSLCESVGITLTSSAPAATPPPTSASTPTSTPTTPATTANAAPSTTPTTPGSGAGLTHPVNGLFAFAAAAGGVLALAL